MQTPRSRWNDEVSLEQVEAEFQKELDEGRKWYEQLRDRELSWIRDGKNPEAEFDRLYAADPVVSGMEVRDPLTPGEWWKRVFLIGGIVIVVVFVAGPAATMLLLRRDRSRRARSLG
jgi:hypothetical protein